MIALIVLAVVIGAALNWSWLVAVGIAPLLITVLPCAAMCGLGAVHEQDGRRLVLDTRPGSVETPRSRPPGWWASLEGGEPGPALLASDRVDAFAG